jgi:hypothetical protein
MYLSGRFRFHLDLDVYSYPISFLDLTYSLLVALLDIRLPLLFFGYSAIRLIDYDSAFSLISMWLILLALALALLVGIYDTQNFMLTASNTLIDFPIRFLIGDLLST